MKSTSQRLRHPRGTNQLIQGRMQRAAGAGAWIARWLYTSVIEFIYIYIYYVYIYMYIPICMCIYIIYMCVCVYIYIYIYLYLYPCVCVFMG